MKTLVTMAAVLISTVGYAAADELAQARHMVNQCYAQLIAESDTNISTAHFHKPHTELKLGSIKIPTKKYSRFMVPTSVAEMEVEISTPWGATRTEIFDCYMDDNYETQAVYRKEQ